MASSSVVIKAKYRKTLRRFRASISNKKLALDLVMLRDKIRGFFGFGFGDEFTMKYVDEDGDLVMLASDDDLHDIVLQSLNPLRITVKLNKERKLGGTSGTTVAPLTSEVSETFQSPQKESQFRLSNSLVPKIPCSSSQLEPQIHILKSGVTQTLNSSSLQQPHSQSINSAVSQSLKSSLQQIPSQTLNTVAEPSTSKISQLSEKMNEAHVNPKFTFTAGGASNVYGQHTTNFLSSTVKDSVSKVQVKPKFGSTNSKKEKKLVSEVVESTVPSFGFIKPFPMPINATKGLKDSGSKLDSICVSDVTIPDVTTMAPYAKFTKIWKMRNIGSLAWPQGSKFMCVSGVRSSRDSDSVDIEIPADGLPVDKDLDIKVEFTAPRHPFWYVSSWRMVSPSGQKFGSMVSVSFQVENIAKDFGETMANVNPPPVVRNPEVVNQDHLMDAENSFIKVSGSEGAVIDSQSKDQENDSDVSSNMATPSVTSAFSSTEVKTALASLSVGLDTGSKVQPNIQEVTDDQEQALLKDLEVMGFKQLEMNKEILRINDYDLEKSVDDLCGVSDWDLMVDDLQAAGYADAKSRLLKKNNGSIKRVSNGKLESNNSVPMVEPLDSNSREVSLLSDDKEQKLLKYLKEIGFRKLNLNKKILRMNSYDLEKSIDDLCCALEWEPMLDNLQEMGFVDEETNRRLLEKNDGSITLTVMDLINEEAA